MTLFSNLFQQKRTRIELELTDYEIGQLRHIMDNLPLNPYAGLACAVVKKLPLSAVVPAPDADATTVPTQRGTVVGFSLNARTAKGRAMLPQIEEMFSRLPHGEDVL